MRKAALLYNPDSGGSQRRQKELESALTVLRAGGVEADLVPTESRDHAGDETRMAMDSGCDTIFACGGDGPSVHDRMPRMPRFVALRQETAAASRLSWQWEP